MATDDDGGATAPPASFPASATGRTARTRWLRRLRGAAGMLALVALAGWAAHAVALRAGLARLGEAASHRLDVEATRLEGELARFEFLPPLLETSPQVLDLLAAPRDAARRAEASRYLHALNAIAGAEILYVLDPTGYVAASSDDGQPGTPAGRDLSYRPYFRDALVTGRGRFYGLGVTSGVPGDYLAYALPRGGPLRGVATVKVDLRRAEQAWAQLPGEMLLVDTRGVVVLASHADWKYRPLAPLDEAARQEVAQARRYGEARLVPLAWRELARLDAHSTRVRAEGRAYVATAHDADGGRWRLLLLSDEAPVRAAAGWAGASAALLAAVLLLAALVLRQRRRIVREQLASRAALQAAHDSLERRVQERTAELRAAQAELVHAGQLAVLGQMSAGMVHELNQPLAALHTLSDNAALLLERGRAEDARANLGRIAQLVARLGKLTAQLKVFAHKRTEPPEPVPLDKAVREALLLHGQRVRDLGVAVAVALRPPALAVLAEETRLVQVLGNLVGNALDAMAEEPPAGPPRRLAIEAAAPPAGAPCRIVVANSGPPIPPAVAARLFEPFFTTKPAGRGLGLGLMISSHIVQAFGGSLRAAQAGELPAGMGAAFFVELPAAESGA